MKFILICLFASISSVSFGDSDQKIINLVREDLLGKEDPLAHTVHRKLRWLGNKTIELETFLSFEGDYSLAKNIFSDWKKMGIWALHRINERPTGGTYYVQVTGLIPDEADQNILHGNFLFDFPVFKKKMERVFTISVKKEEESFSLEGIAMPSPASPIGPAQGFVKLFRGQGLPRRVWAYLHGTAVFKNPLLYELLPKALIERESMERMRILLDNYQVEEGKRRGVANK